MSTLNKDTLKECLLESALQEIREIEALGYHDIKADEEFKNKIRGVISNAEQQSSTARSRRITLSLIAAIIVCFSIIVSVFAQIRTAVANFFVEIYDSFVVLLIDSEDDEDELLPIETAYESSYFKENGYEQASQTTDKFKIFTVWTKDSSKLYFSQHSIYKNDITLDAEDTSYEATYVGDIKVYYTIKNDTYFIKWLEYDYSFNLTCNSSLEWTEIEKIISSLQPIS